MLLLEAENLSFQHGERTIFQDVGLSVHSEDKIGLIGNNGAGKSTLLRMLTGVDTAPQAILRTSNQLTLEYLSQNRPLYPERSVMEEVFADPSPLFETVRQYESALVLVQKNPSNEAFTKRLYHWQEEMDRLDAWQLESNARSILHRLGITDYDAKMGHLSGGMRKRVALATTLIRPANLLLLDEPTNHLDYETIQWLENELAERQCALIVVTHDRYFLDRVCNTILELDKGILYSHQGNYSAFLTQKAQRLSEDNRRQDKMQQLFKQELAWMRKGVEARRTKQKARQERFHQLSEQLQPRRENTLEMDFKTARLGRKIIEVDNLSKAYGKNVLFHTFTYAFVKDDRIGILGRNGSGKSTLLNLLAGEDQDYSGEIAHGETVRIGYYRQDQRDLPQDMAVLPFIRSIGESITRSDGSRLTATVMLEAFLFRPDQMSAPISALSGGEQKRLYLLSVLMQDINVLLLDEPTNDLDIGTLQVLEDFLQHFPGPVVTVSHDRYFLDRVCNQLFVIDSNAHLQQHRGDFSDYLAQLEAEPPAIKSAKKTGSDSRKKQPAPPKLSWQERKDYETIEDDITEMEENLAELEKSMEAHASQYTELLKLQEKHEALQLELEEKYQRWEALEEKIARIESERIPSHG